MGNATFSKYIEAWANHGDGRDETAQAMIEAATADISYGDIHSPEPFRGADGLRMVNQFAAQLFSSLTFDIQDRIYADNRWALTWEAHGTHRASQKTFRFRGASVGTVTEDGRSPATPISGTQDSSRRRWDPCAANEQE